MIILPKNGRPIRPVFSSFPDGQPHVKVPVRLREHYDAVQIKCSIRNPLEMFQLRMVCQVMKNFTDEIDIDIYWLYGARMDRAIDEFQPSTFQEVVSDLCCISNTTQTYLGFSPKIRVLDIHNPKVVPAWIKPIPLDQYIHKAIGDFGFSPDIVFPDKGAKERYQGYFDGAFNTLYCGKTRDSATGKLTGFHLESGDRKSDTAIIIDDLLDGGGTFLGQAQVLRGMGYNRLGLYITHGLFTKGTESLAKEFSHIYSTNSYQFGQGGKDELELIRWV